MKGQCRKPASLRMGSTPQSGLRGESSGGRVCAGSSGNHEPLPSSLAGRVGGVRQDGGGVGAAEARANAGARSSSGAPHPALRATLPASEEGNACAAIALPRFKQPLAIPRHEWPGFGKDRIKPKSCRLFGQVDAPAKCKGPEHRATTSNIVERGFPASHIPEKLQTFRIRICA